MINDYTVITELSDNHGNVLRAMQSFPKSREGLEAAYEYASESGAYWEILFGEELIDSLGDHMQRHFGM